MIDDEDDDVIVVLVVININKCRYLLESKGGKGRGRESLKHESR